MSKHLTEGRMSKGGQNDPSDMGERPPAPQGSGGESEATMTTSVGSELDAAVLRILGWEFSKMVRFGQLSDVCRKEADCFWDDIPRLSTDPNGHEALRLCGPWLDEQMEAWHIHYWQAPSGKNLCSCTGRSKSTQRLYEVGGATRAEAICRLAEAAAEREGT